MVQLNRKIISLIIIFILIFSFIALGSDLNKDISNIRIYQLSYNLETDAVKIDACIPVIKGLENKISQDNFNQKIRDSILNFTDDIESQAEKFFKTSKQEDFRFRQYQAMVTNDLKSKGDILSLVFKYYQYTGGAHGLTSVVSYNLDTDTGKDISLKEFLTRTNLNIDQVKEIIVTEIGENPNNYFPDAIETIRNKNNFSYYVKDNSLFIYFQSYDIAPYAAGNPQFEIKLGVSKMSHLHNY